MTENLFVAPGVSIPETELVWIVIVSQRTRSQPQNRADAREKLAELVRLALVQPKRRRPTRPTAGSRQRRIESKRHQSSKKQNRRSRDDD